MNSLIFFFNCGGVENHSGASAVNFVVVKLSNLTGNIIPFFDNYPLIGSKARDYEDFKAIANLMTHKAHLTKEGVEEIAKIKSRMNLSREHRFPRRTRIRRKNQKNSQYFYK